MIFTRKKIVENKVVPQINKRTKIIKLIYDKLNTLCNKDNYKYFASNHQVVFITDNITYNISINYRDSRIDISIIKKNVDIEESEDEEDDITNDKSLRLYLKDNEKYSYYKFSALFSILKDKLDRYNKQIEVDDFYDYMFESDLPG